MKIISIEIHDANEMNKKTVAARNRLVALVVKEVAEEIEKRAEAGYDWADLEFGNREENITLKILEEAADNLLELGYYAREIKNRKAVSVSWDKASLVKAKEYKEYKRRYKAMDF
jgi:hypothetical protein